VGAAAERPTVGWLLGMNAVKHETYDRIGVGYAGQRRADPRIASCIGQALGPATTVVNVGAGSGSYEPCDRVVVAVEPAVTMIYQRPDNAGPVVRAYAETLPFRQGEFDAALAILTVHHSAQRPAGLPGDVGAPVAAYGGVRGPFDPASEGASPPQPISAMATVHATIRHLPALHMVPGLTGPSNRWTGQGQQGGWLSHTVWGAAAAPSKRSRRQRRLGWRSATPRASAKALARFVSRSARVIRTLGLPGATKVLRIRVNVSCISRNAIISTDYNL